MKLPDKNERTALGEVGLSLLFCDLFFFRQFSQAEKIAKEILDEGGEIPVSHLHAFPNLRRRAWDRYLASHASHFSIHLLNRCEEFKEWGWEFISKNPTPVTLVLLVTENIGEYQDEVLALIPEAVKRASVEGLELGLLSCVLLDDPSEPKFMDIRDALRERILERCQAENINICMGDKRWTLGAPPKRNKPTKIKK